PQLRHIEPVNPKALFEFALELLRLLRSGGVHHPARLHLSSVLAGELDDPRECFRLPPHLLHGRNHPVFEGEDGLDTEETAYQRLGLADSPVPLKVLERVDDKEYAELSDQLPA